jgi:hypothetical protein
MRQLGESRELIKPCVCFSNRLRARVSTYCQSFDLCQNFATLRELLASSSSFGETSGFPTIHLLFQGVLNLCALLAVQTISLGSGSSSDPDQRQRSCPIPVFSKSLQNCAESHALPNLVLSFQGLRNPCVRLQAASLLAPSPLHRTVRPLRLRLDNPWFKHRIIAFQTKDT